MDMVDVVITRIVFSGHKSRSVHFFQRPYFGNMGLLVILEESRPSYWGVWGAEPPRKNGSYILLMHILLMHILYIIDR